jgi:hypothetical protein
LQRELIGDRAFLGSGSRCDIRVLQLSGNFSGGYCATSIF